MKPLTDTQRAILRDAAGHPDGLAAPPAKLPPAPRGAVAKALLAATLLAPAEGDEGQHPGLAWKVGGAAVLLRITAAGRRAIGAALAAASPEPQQGSVGAPAAEPAGQAAAGGPGGRARGCRACWRRADHGGIRSRPGRLRGHSAAYRARRSSRRCAGGARRLGRHAEREHAGLAEAIERLRQGLAKPATAPSASGPRPPRAGTKQEAVLALLRRPEGASGPAIAAATGWAPHTVRGFLAGLKARGVAVLVHERVRQAGPGKAGAKGSYTIYRVAEAG